MTCGAASWLLPPAWSAAMVQGPAASAVTVLPATEQVEAVRLVNVTGFPEAPPVAETDAVPPYTSAVAGTTWTLVVVRNGIEVARRSGVRGRTDGNIACTASFPGVVVLDL